MYLTNTTSSHFDFNKSFHLIPHLPTTLPARNKYTSLVCSCYVSTRHPKNKDEDNDISRSSSEGKRSSARNRDGVPEKLHNCELQDQDRNRSCSNRRSRESQRFESSPLKSNLKKTTTAVEEHQHKDKRRRVNWPDAHGKDLAHIQEFESSVLEDGELEGVRNSCICAIQ